MVVHVLSFLEFAYQQASTVPTVDEPAVCEIVFYFASLVLGASIQQLLNALPTLPAYSGSWVPWYVMRSQSKSPVYTRFLTIS
jgi:hypothetical protein